MILADPASPVYMQGAFDIAAAMVDNKERVETAFRTGKGVGWGEQAGCLFCATGRFFRPGYQNSLVSAWLPELHDVIAKLESGGVVADVGCGHGFSTVIMARAFPKSTFIGYDFHAGSVEQAKVHAAEHGVTANTRFEVATAQDFPAKDLDLAIPPHRATERMPHAHPARERLETGVGHLVDIADGAVSSRNRRNRFERVDHVFACLCRPVGREHQVQLSYDGTGDPGHQLDPLAPGLVVLGLVVSRLDQVLRSHEPHASVDDEWSFIETLRHLAFVTDAWVRRGILGDPAPWDPLDLPWDQMPETPGIPRDREVRPSLDEVLVLRRDRLAGVRTLIDSLTEESLGADTTPVEGPGWPPSQSFPVIDCLLVVLNEEWLHRKFAERDLDRLTES